MKTFIICAVIFFLLIFGAYLWQCDDDWCYMFEWQKIEAADSFDRCAQLGFPIMESYPRQCRAGDKTFTENIIVGNDKIHIFTPAPNSIVKSPILIRGEARGQWYFEASFPIKILDENGKDLAIQPAQAQGEWMTTEFVPFELNLAFSTPTTATGTLVFEKDNPSGLPEHADSFIIPIRFR
ncbi:MAG: Gmad2 immunoglobulin-like domain-containing protein [Patescibacteria group bacterium]